MRIRSIEIRRFRSIERASLQACGGLNVLIGKNNAGKSNVLAAIELVHRHLQAGTIAGVWSTRRPLDEFTDRQVDAPLQIGVEFDLPQRLNESLRQRLQIEAPHLERSIDQIKAIDRVAMVVAGVHQNNEAFLFIQQLAAGTLASAAPELTTQGINLLSVPTTVAGELFALRQETSDLRDDLQLIARLEQSARLESLLEQPERMGRYYLEAAVGPEIRPALRRQLVSLLAAAAGNLDEARNRLSALSSELREKVDALDHRETEGSISTFAGAAKAPPAYAIWLMKEYGSFSMLHLRETRDPIGREEAGALLTLKVTRGGPERLQAVQMTVRALLGVEVDAFQSEDPRQGPGRGAEMDIDQFLVEANGAGVREALRLVLDLELKTPTLLLLEEPEAHLHPGLEHAVYSYLRERSQAVQMFVTTHSTNFVDSVSFQNIYLVSRNGSGRTALEQLDAGDGAVKVPAELGLRLSTVFMYDRLVFVEGPSDEAVLRELAKTLGIDLSKVNVGFVQMGGVRNFAHFAADATIALLSRRQIRLWFISDRDERDDSEVRSMVECLGHGATLKVLNRRELENYMLDPEAVGHFLAEKRAAAGLSTEPPSRQEITASIGEEARGLKDEVIRLRYEGSALKPIFLQRRDQAGTPEERLARAVEDLSDRLKSLVATRERIAADVEESWEKVALDRAPGGLILDRVARRYDVRFSKESGDSARLARLVSKEAIPEELQQILREVTDESPR
jgi:putative ATP-dependent endonuclease of the OLD family